MYRVILVDDEPIILSGIKFMLDWSEQDCEIVGTARNGQQALDLINTAAPDIVICDIRMPVKSGIELLEEVSSQETPPIFIMLTNHEDFDLARQSMRLRAVDYLLKNQLDAPALEKSLQSAKKECDKRGNLAGAAIEAHYIQAQRSEALRAAALDVLLDPNNLTAQGLLARHGTLSHYYAVQLLFDLSTLPALSNFSQKDRRQLINWEYDIVEKLSQNLFEHFVLSLPNYDAQTLLLIAYDLTEAPDFELFYRKIADASANTTQVQVALLCSDRFNTPSDLHCALNQLEKMHQLHYTSGENVLSPTCLTKSSSAKQSLDVHDLCNRIALELRAKNKSAALDTLQKAIDLLQNTPHLHEDGIRCCSELYSICSMILVPMTNEPHGFFCDTGTTLSEIRTLSTQAQVVDWLRMLGSKLETQLDILHSSHSAPLDRARQYVRSHVDERILLQDAASAAGLSPSYLSALFKKEYNQNFMDFVNETKMKRACQLMQEGRYRIYEISYMLGFENAYYFTRVFRRHVGMTPTEYQRNLHPERSENKSLETNP